MSSYRDSRTLSVGDSSKEEGLLFTKSSDVNKSRSHDYDVPLREAIRQGRIDWCRELVSRGAAVDNMDCAGRTLLHEASDCGRLDILELLLEAGATRLVNARAIGGDTASHLAARCGFGPVVKALVKAGADLRMKSSRGQDVQQEAVTFGHQRTATLIDSLLQPQHYS